MMSDRDTFGEVWQSVVAELNNDAAAHDHEPLTRQQKAWLSLVQPLTLAEGFALLTVPTPLVQEQIERNLRDTIRSA
ncbi:chromosomal replication initiation protein DnaA, partial [Streptomyces sp. SID10244]|nr:chromosomal replication initiation protein DnaA [Streptomyces sp. SID10244]